MESANTAPIRYVGFWRRLTAYGIDSTLVQIIGFLLIYLLGSVANAATPEESINLLIQLGWLPPPQPGQSVTDVLMASGASGAPLLGLGDLFILTATSAIYNIWFTAGQWKATPGKHWCRMHVIRDDGKPLTLGMSAARWFASGVSWLPLGFGYLMVGFTKEKQAMHDAICGTRVIHGRLSA
ncbi:MAG: hypothetical protein DI582_03885 [Azospirillum brasilense]|nr:MAG: hypothetical protein DI582_03885 [Azospirillum brasilense]